MQSLASNTCETRPLFLALVICSWCWKFLPISADNLHGSITRPPVLCVCALLAKIYMVQSARVVVNACACYREVNNWVYDCAPPHYMYIHECVPNTLARASAQYGVLDYDNYKHGA